jgi:hypothetical protein
MLGDVFNILLRISAEPDEAQAALSKVAADLAAFGKLEADARVGVKGADEARAKLTDLQGKIDALHGKDVKVDVDTSRVSARLSTLRGELDRALAGGDSRALSRVVRDVESVGRDIEAVASRVGVRFTDRIVAGIAGLPSKIAGFLSNLPGQAFSALSRRSG